MNKHYVLGFMQKCAEAGVDHNELAKFAQTMGPAGGKLMAAAPTAAEQTAFKAKVQAKRAPAAPVDQGMAGQAAKNRAMLQQVSSAEY